MGCSLRCFRDEDLIIPESMTQDFDFTVVLETQAHSRLRNCFSGAAVESKDKSGSGIIESSSLTLNYRWKPTHQAI